METTQQDPCRKFSLRLEAISEILADVNSEIDTGASYYILLDHVSTQLDVSAVALSIRTSFSKLENIARLGFRTSEGVRSIVYDTNSLAQKVLESRQIIRFNQSSPNSVSDSFRKFMTQERFYDYLGMPLVENKQVLGVLEMFSSRPLNASADWRLHLKFIRSLASNTPWKRLHRTIARNPMERSSTRRDAVFGCSPRGPECTKRYPDSSTSPI